MAASPKFLAPIGRWLWNWFGYGAWRAIDKEVEDEQAARRDAGSGSKTKKKSKKSRSAAVKATRSGYDFRPLIVLVVVAVSLTLQEYWGSRGEFMRLFPRAEMGLDEKDYQLLSFCWWSGWRFLGYVAIPVLVLWSVPGERVRDYFVSFKGFFRHIWVYALLFGLVLPAVIAASTQKSFAATYPFYKYANHGGIHFWAWQGLYALQFVSLEFFFRGFMLAGLRDRFGSAAIFVMIVPYCMIHYGKPMPETLGAIVAGLVLGAAAMRTRSIWGGAIVHIAVAITMDTLAIGHCPDPSTGRPCGGH